MKDINQWKEEGFAFQVRFPNEYDLWFNKKTKQTLRRYVDGREYLTNPATGVYELVQDDCEAQRTDHIPLWKKEPTPLTDAEAGYEDGSGCWKYNPKGNYTPVKLSQELEQKLGYARWLLWRAGDILRSAESGDDLADDIDTFFAEAVTKGRLK